MDIPILSFIACLLHRMGYATWDLMLDFLGPRDTPNADIRTQLAVALNEAIEDGIATGKAKGKHANGKGGYGNDRVTYFVYDLDKYQSIKPVSWTTYLNAFDALNLGPLAQAFIDEHSVPGHDDEDDDNSIADNAESSPAVREDNAVKTPKLILRIKRPLPETPPSPSMPPPSPLVSLLSPLVLMPSPITTLNSLLQQGLASPIKGWTPPERTPANDLDGVLSDFMQFCDTPADIPHIIDVGGDEARNVRRKIVF
jgi:hypothetical protein